MRQQAVRALLLSILVFCAGCSWPGEAPVALDIGGVAPVRQLDGTGEAFQPGNSTALVAFLNTQADGRASTGDPSRAQIPFLISMYNQYAGQGLRVLIVDASALTTRTPSSADQLINFGYDWHLNQISLVADPDGEIARAYGVLSTPTTFLLDHSGVVRQKWSSYASAGQLALGIQHTLGLDVFGTPLAASTCAATPAQAMFPGLPLARPLSRQVWLVDGGDTWREGMPVRWLVFAEANQQLQLDVSMGNAGNAQQPLLSAALTELPADEAHALLLDTALVAYALSTQIPPLPSTACLQITATIRDQHNQVILNGLVVVGTSIVKT